MTPDNQTKLERSKYKLYYANQRSAHVKDEFKLGRKNPAKPIANCNPIKEPNKVQ